MKAEGFSFGAAVYVTAITALTVGYGDITPKTAAGQVVSVAIASIGVLFNGLIVAIATRALAHAAEDKVRLVRRSRQQERAAKHNASPEKR